MVHISQQRRPGKVTKEIYQHCAVLCGRAPSRLQYTKKCISLSLCIAYSSIQSNLYNFVSVTKYTPYILTIQTHKLHRSRTHTHAISRFWRSFVGVRAHKAHNGARSIRQSPVCLSNTVLRRDHLTAVHQNKHILFRMYADEIPA